jgi:hypothetical protein
MNINRRALITAADQVLAASKNLQRALENKAVSIAVVRHCIEEGAWVGFVEWRKDNGWGTPVRETAAERAMRAERWDLVEILAKALQAEPGEQSKGAYKMLLTIASETGKVEAIKAVLTAGDVGAFESYGAFMAIIKKDLLDGATMLLERGIRWKSDDGERLASEVRSVEMLRALVGAGLRLSLQKENDNSALHQMLIKRRRLDPMVPVLTKEFLKLGASAITKGAGGEPKGYDAEKVAFDPEMTILERLALTHRSIAPETARLLWDGDAPWTQRAGPKFLEAIARAGIAIDWKDSADWIERWCETDELTSVSLASLQILMDNGLDIDIRRPGKKCSIVIDYVRMQALGEGRSDHQSDDEEHSWKDGADKILALWVDAGGNLGNREAWGWTAWGAYDILQDSERIEAGRSGRHERLLQQNIISRPEAVGRQRL